MRASIFLILPAALMSAVSGELERRATANCSPGNNCQRGVGGTAANEKPALSSRLADCSSLNTVTVTPATFTTTTTTTILVPTATAKKAKKRQDAGGTAVTVMPTSVPAYATYCADASKYYSACSCAGVTAVTTTAPTPTATETDTVTETCSLQSKVKRVVNAFMTMAYIR